MTHFYRVYARIERHLRIQYSRIDEELLQHKFQFVTLVDIIDKYEPFSLHIELSQQSSQRSAFAPEATRA